MQLDEEKILKSREYYRKIREKCRERMKIDPLYAEKIRKRKKKYNDEQHRRERERRKTDAEYNLRTKEYQRIHWKSRWSKNKDKIKKHSNECWKKHREKLSDIYIRDLIAQYVRYRGGKISVKDISQEDIERYRKYVIARDAVKLDNNMTKEEQLKQFKERYDELYKKLANTPSFDRQTIYQERSYLKKKIKTMEDFQELAVLGTETPPVKEEITISQENIYLSEKEELMKEAELLLSRIEKYNQRIESLKITL